MAELVKSPAYHGGILDMGAGHLHPLNFALGLARAAQQAGVRLYENTAVTQITPGTPARVETARGHILADQVILAANGYLGGLNRQVASRVMPINNFIVATAPLARARQRC